MIDEEGLLMLMQGRHFGCDPPHKIMPAFDVLLSDIEPFKYPIYES